MSAVKHNKIKLREVNRHLVCRLCRGYYVDATTIAECLHSFCRSCIIKYLEKNSFCPICEVQIHKTKPYLNLRLDKALQDVVYKLVPGLYHDEMKRRREFYSKHQEQIPITTPEQCGLEERIIFSPDDSISLSLEYLGSDDYESENVSSQSSEAGDNPDGLSFPLQLGLMKLKNNEGRNSRRESQDVQEPSTFPKRYLQCPAVVNVAHLKKFVRMKHDLTDKMQVDIIHKRVPLLDHYTLMDVAYIYTWKRSSPLRFFYQIYQTKKHRVKIPPALPEPKDSSWEVSKPPKDVVDGKLVNGNVAKPVIETNKNSKPSDVKIEVPVSDKRSGSEVDPATYKNPPKSVDANKSTAEPKRETKKETLANGAKEEKNERPAPAEKKPAEVPKKPEPRTGGTLEKLASEKVKSAEVKNGLQDPVDSKPKDQTRVLLNPISGQLESVPSVNQEKTSVNGTLAASEQKEETAADPAKSVEGEKGKKEEADSEKDAKKSSVNLLKSFRKEKITGNKEAKAEVKSPNGSSLTITKVVKKGGEVSEREPATVSVEIKTENKSSEYDFDGASPPGKIMPLQEFSKYSKYMADHKEKWLSKQSKSSWVSLQDFRQHMLKENYASGDSSNKYKRKSVPSLFRINADGSKKSGRKTPNGKLGTDKTKEKKMSPTIINIQTESENNVKADIKVEAPKEEAAASLPLPLKVDSNNGTPKSVPQGESKSGGELSGKKKEEQGPKTTSPGSAKVSPEGKKPEESTAQKEGNKSKEPGKSPPRKSGQDKPDVENPKKSKTMAEEGKSDRLEAMDLSKTETSPKSVKNPLENLMDMANKSGTAKSDEKMVEALISVAQKQSIEPLLKIPQYSQNLKNAQGSPPPGKNISSNDISQALQFFKDLRSDLKILEAKSQLSPNSFLEQFSHKSANLEPIQLYQQHIDLIRRLKRQHMAVGESDTPTKKRPKLSPTSESKKKFSPPSEGKPKAVLDEAAQFKSSVERTLSQIQEQMEIQSRMVAAQSYKNLPTFLQFYHRPGSFCPGPASPSKSGHHKTKSSSHSPNSQKSPTSAKPPQGLASPSGPQSLPVPPTSDASFFASQSYSHLINAGLNSEMTFHQMFQNYLNQQEKLNQIKYSPAAAKKSASGGPSPKALSDLYYGSQPSSVKKPETQKPVAPAAAQKT